MLKTPKILPLRGAHSAGYSRLNAGGVIMGLVLLIWLISPSKVQAQTFQQYQQEAAQNNPKVRAAFQQYLAALEEAPQVGALPDPELAFGYFISPIETRVGPQKARLSLTQMFPWYGTLGNRRQMADSKARAQFEIFQETRNRVFYQVETTLLNLYELEESIRIADENLTILNSLVEISLRRYETNQATQVDVLRAQIEQEDLKTNLALLKDNRRVLLQKMKELLNREGELNLQLPDSLHREYQLVNHEELFQKLMQQNPDLNKLRYLEQTSLEMKELAAKDGKPSFGVGLDYIFTGERNGVTGLSDNGKDAFMVRASFRIPLFRNKYSAKVRQAELSIESAQNRLDARKNQLQTDLDAVIRDIEDADRRYKLYDTKQIQRVNQALNIMMEAYSTDNSGFEEILRMQRKLLSYQLSRIQALTDLHKSGAYLDYLTGKHNIGPEEVR